MVRSYLIESRICFKGDGGGNTGGSAGDNARETATPAQTDDRGRPLARGTTNVIDTSRQILPPIGASQEDEDVDQDREQAIAAAATLANPNADAAQQQIIRDNLTRFPTGGVDQSDFENRVRETAAINQIPVGGQDVLGMVRTAAAQSLSQPNRPDPVTPTMAPGRRDPMSGFYADAYDALYGTPDPNDAPATAPGTFINTLFGGGPIGEIFNAPDPADSAAFAFGQRQRMQQDPTFVPPTTNMATNVGQNDERAAPPPPPAADPADPGTTTPEVIDDLATNYLLNPFYLYSGTGNLYQPYGYAGGTLVDLLQTRGMTQPQQAAPNLNIFGNPRDFS